MRYPTLGSDWAVILGWQLGFVALAQAAGYTQVDYLRDILRVRP